MVSLLVTANDKPKMEMVGREGVVGASELLLHPQGAMGLNLIQIPGAVLRVDAAPSVRERSDRHERSARDMKQTQLFDHP